SVQRACRSIACGGDPYRRLDEGRPGEVACGRVGQRTANSISIVTTTETGWPRRMPGRKRHCDAALIASCSRPYVGLQDRRPPMLLHTPLGGTTHCTVIAPCARARIASVLYCGAPFRISIGSGTSLP